MGREYFMMTDLELKNLYERFCFLNCLTEINISQGEDIFSKYGYKLQVDEEKNKVIVGIKAKEKKSEGK